ncbi:general substrate transporter [Lactarius akahatsu]|uniref:General substrate transporter n=1 Tax=Lactarius akahatsu TaxID=416441 RepID=A0AAD4QFA9_9AGAM|nr:general substrate transporter [Lactarius akahatsu]
MAIHDRTVASSIHLGPWWRHRGVLVLNLYLLIPLLTSCVNGYDSSLINGLQLLQTWQAQFSSPRSEILGIVTSTQMIGGLMGLPFAPRCSDRFGRRVTMFAGALLMLAGVGLQAAALSIVLFTVARLLIGVGLVFSLNAAPLLITELAYPTQRGKMTSLYNASWYGGSIVAAWVCLAGTVSGDNVLSMKSSWSWRVPVLIQGVGPLLQIFLIWIVPESPRWLVSKGQESKAAKILARFHSVGFDERNPLVLFEIVQIRRSLRMEKNISKRVSFATLFSTPGNRKRMRIILGLTLFSQWSGNGLASFYINLVLENVGIRNQKVKAVVNGCLQMWNLVAALSGALLVDRVGRRTLFIVSNAGMLMSVSVLALSAYLFHSGIPAAANATIPLIFFLHLFYNLAYTPTLVAYTSEILPFTIRAKGFAFMNLTVSLALALNQFYIVYCVWLCFGLVFVMKFTVETHGKTPEEIAVLFDGERKPDHIPPMVYDITTISMDNSSTPGVERDENFSCTCIATEAYELKLPHRIVEKDRVGGRGRVRVL